MNKTNQQRKRKYQNTERFIDKEQADSCWLDGGGRGIEQKKK